MFLSNFFNFCEGSSQKVWSSNAFWESLKVFFGYNQVQFSMTKNTYFALLVNIADIFVTIIINLAPSHDSPYIFDIFVTSLPFYYFLFLENAKVFLNVW